VAPKSKKHLVFVYGSLMTGLDNHYLLEGATAVATAVLMEPCVMIDCGHYPGLVRVDATDDRAASTKGEVYEVDDDTLKRLDELEGVPRYYQRAEGRVAVHGDSADCQVMFYAMPPRYLLNGPRLVAPNAAGLNDWRAHYKNEGN
jgi:gamma-glutamylaminecyclotransferase